MTTHHQNLEASRAAKQRVWEIAQSASIVVSHQGQTFADLPRSDSGRTLLPIRSSAFRDWIVNFYTEQNGRPPREQNVRAAIRTLDSIAHAGRHKHLLVFQRIGAYGERKGPAVPDPTIIVIDLANTAGEVVLITPHF